MPFDVQPIPGGRFDIVDGQGQIQEAYSSSVSGHHAFFARSSGGSGVIVYNISDRSNPTFVGDIATTNNGGYVFRNGDTLFVGESDVARVLDGSDLTDIQILAEVTMPGDLDTLMPYGNIAFLSADEDAADGEATAVYPWARDPDSDAPKVLHVDPADGAVDQEPTLRLGIGFSEFIEPSSAFAGSIRLFDADDLAIPGIASAQEGFAHYSPTTPLLPGTYRAEVVAGGVTDANGNAVEETFSWTFSVRGP